MAKQDNQVFDIKQFHVNEIIMEAEQNQQGELSVVAMAEELRNLFGDGHQVVMGLNVSQNATPGMLVDIAVGMAKSGSDGKMFYSEDTNVLVDVDTSTLAVDGLPIILDQAVSIAVPSSHPTLNRIDIVEIRLAQSDNDLRSREIIDPSTGAIAAQNKYTRRKLACEYRVTAGTAGITPVAPAKNDGWTKIAEIHVNAGVTTILNADIFNVNARFSGDNNLNWTTDVSITFKSANMKTHREQAIIDHKDGSISWEKLASGVQNTITGGSRVTAFWGKIVWASATGIVIFPDSNLGVIRVILEDGSVIERSTEISISITTAANRLDGLSLLNNSWYSIIFYQDLSTGNLEAKFWALPYDTISSVNSGGLVTVAGTNAKGFSVGSEVVLWKASNNFDAPFYRNNAGTPSYQPNAANTLKVTSVPGTKQLQLTDRSSGIGVNTTYGSPDIIYAVSNLRPVVHSSGNFPSEFAGNLKWKDSGIRIRTDGSGNIVNFMINNNYYFESADVTIATNTPTSFTNFKVNTIPPDKTLGVWVMSNQAELAQNVTFYRNYFDNSMNEIMGYIFAGNSTIIHKDVVNIPLYHSIIGLKREVAGGGNHQQIISTIGYAI